MKYTLHILVVLISMFFIHVVAYFSLSDYRFFWEKLKNTDEIVYVDTDTIDIDDTFSFENNELISTTNPIETIIEETIEKVPDNIIQTNTKIVLWEKYQDILRLFSDYSFDTLESNLNLFDITDEYPDYYYEYYHPDMTLYFFPTKRYNDIEDIFSVLAISSPFELNTVNNFGNQSSYINLDENVDDGQVRIIIEYDGITFWLKIKKTQYNTVKELLLWL